MSARDTTRVPAQVRSKNKQSKTFNCCQPNIKPACSNRTSSPSSRDPRSHLKFNFNAATKFLSDRYLPAVWLAQIFTFRTTPHIMLRRANTSRSPAP